MAETLRTCLASKRFAEEFISLLEESSNNLITKWDGYRERIIEVGKKTSPAIANMIDAFEETDSKAMCALYTLIFILHRLVTMFKQKQQSTSRAGALFYFLQNKPFGTSIDATAAGKDEKYVQSYILSLGPAKNPSKFFIVADRIPIPAGTNIIQGVDRSFKAHYAFKVHYALALHQFWEFLAAFLYGVIPATSVKAPMRSLASNIKLISPK